MNFQDWKEVGWDKRGEKPKNETNKTFLNNQIRKGNVTQSLKKGSSNQNQIIVVTNAKKIPENIIKNFESGKALYNAVIINKLEKYLGKRLRD